MEKRKKTVMGNREFIISFFPWVAKKLWNFFFNFLFILLLYFIAIGFINLLVGFKLDDNLFMPILIIGLIIAFITSILFQIQNSID